MKDTDSCPKCGTSWDDGDVLEVLTAHPSYADYTPERLLEAAGHYGWTRETPVRFSKLISVYDAGRDRTTHYQCPSCNATFSLEEITR